MDFLNHHLLTILTFMPLVGVAFILMFMKEKDAELIKRFTTGWLLTQFIISLALWTNWGAGLDITAKLTADQKVRDLAGMGFAFVERAPWI